MIRDLYKRTYQSHQSSTQIRGNPPNSNTSTTPLLPRSAPLSLTVTTAADFLSRGDNSRPGRRFGSFERRLVFTSIDVIHSFITWLSWFCRACICLCLLLWWRAFLDSSDFVWLRLISSVRSLPHLLDCAVDSDLKRIYSAWHIPPRDFWLYWNVNELENYSCTIPGCIASSFPSHKAWSRGSRFHLHGCLNWIVRFNFCKLPHAIFVIFPAFTAIFMANPSHLLKDNPSETILMLLKNPTYIVIDYNQSLKLIGRRKMRGMSSIKSCPSTKATKNVSLTHPYVQECGARWQQCDCTSWKANCLAVFMASFSSQKWRVTLLCSCWCQSTCYYFRSHCCRLLMDSVSSFTLHPQSFATAVNVLVILGHTKYTLTLSDVSAWWLPQKPFPPSLDISR